ncbi:MAG: heme lyase CcmF/NrfE family subunit, partial [Paracoccaceae bacterium]
YELGWGGFWFWDPVENASFMPWLLAAALLHSAIVVEKREALKSWTILLAILAFGFSLIGTFIVRSGVLTSVHAFANDPERGVFILLILTFFTGGALILFSARAGVMEAKGVFGVVSRESALVLNNVLLAVACFVVFVGTIWPLVVELISAKERWSLPLFGDMQNLFYTLGWYDRPSKVSVGPPFFNLAFSPFMIALGAALPIGAMLPWKRGKLGRTFASLRVALALAVALAALAWAMQSGQSALGPLGLFLGAWVVFSAATDLWSRTGRRNDRLRRLTRLPRADWGKAVAHAGLGVTIFAVAGLLAWEQEDIRVAQIGEPFEVGGYTLVLDQVERVRGPNYFSEMAHITASRDGREVAQLRPEKRVYPVAQMPTTEAGIDYRVFRDLYVVIGDRQQENGWTVRTYIKPLANWIWAGSILMALGGFLSLSDRRFRVAAGARKQPAGVPAE